MREVAEQVVGWLVLGGIVLAILVAKRRYENKFANAVAAAAEGGRAEVRAQLGQHVNVAVDASSRPGGGGGAVGISEAELEAAVLAVLRARGPGVPPAAIASGSSAARVHDDHEHDYDYDTRTNDIGRVDVWRRRDIGAVVADDGGRGARDRNGHGDGAGAAGVEVVPCASVTPSSIGSARPELLADMTRRPWAYDEADPRFEGNRGGRGPGR